MSLLDIKKCYTCVHRLDRGYCELKQDYVDTHEKCRDYQSDITKSYVREHLGSSLWNTNK